MTTLEKEIEEVKKKHAELEKQKQLDLLHEKFKKVKALEGTVECRVYKTSKTTRYVSLVHHISYEMMTDRHRREGEDKYNFIGVKFRSISIMENPKAPYKQYEIKTQEITPHSYNGKMYVAEENNSWDYSTRLTDITPEIFESIWALCQTTSHNILDGILNVKEVRWVMNGTSEDRLYDEHDLLDKTKKPVLDIPHILLSTEESWKLDNKFCKLFLNKNIYFITPNSIAALNDWFDYEIASDQFSAQACASVGERWRGSRIDEYRALIAKIKSHK
jgi:hypothetical protein